MNHDLLEEIANLIREADRYKAALIEIRDIARASEGVEFYAMLADKALEGEG